MLITRLAFGSISLVLSLLIEVGIANAQAYFKQLSLKNCFDVILDVGTTSLPIQNSEIRPLSFAFKSNDTDLKEKTEFINASCLHHLKGEINGFSNALHRLFEFNNIPVEKSVSARFEQMNDDVPGQIFLATFDLWMAAYQEKDINQNEGYLTLKKMSDAGIGDASLQLYNFYYENKNVEKSNAIIDEYFSMAAEQGNNYALNKTLFDAYNKSVGGSDEEREALQNLFLNIRDDSLPFERGYFDEACGNEYLIENLSELNEVACRQADKTIFPVSLINESKMTLGGVFDQDQMRVSLDNLITALEHDDKIYFNYVGEYSNRTQAIILLSQIVTVFNINQFYEGDALKQFIKKYKEIMFDKDTLIDVNALPFSISGLLTAEDYIEGFQLSTEEIDLLNIYAHQLLDLNQNQTQTCSEISLNQFFSSQLWPENLPVLSSLKIISASIEDFENYGDGEGIFQLNGKISMMDPSKLYSVLLMPNSSQKQGGCDIYLSEKSVALYPSELQKNFDIDNVVVFPQNINIKNQSGFTQLEKSRLSYHTPSTISWEFFISDKININPNLSNFPFQIGDGTTGIYFEYAEAAHTGIWSILVDETDYILPFGENLPTIDKQNNSIKTNFESYESDSEDLAIKIAFVSNVNYYLLRIILPSTLFVLLSVLAVLAPSNKVPDLLSEAHLQVSTTVLVALVAYQFIIDSELPKLPYYTDLDNFLYCLLFSSALSIAHNLLPHISSSETVRFKFTSGVLKYGTILFFIYAILDFTVKYFRNI